MDIDSFRADIKAKEIHVEITKDVEGISTNNTKMNNFDDNTRGEMKKGNLN